MGRSDPRALVTGGAGFIGSRLVRQLKASGWPVRVLDDLSAGTFTDTHDDPVERLLGSILDREILARACDGVDVVFHLAAQVSVPESIENPDRTQRLNVEGVEHVIEAAAAAGVSGVVFASSCAVYGDPAETPIDETCPLVPTSPYADSKRMGEVLGYEGDVGFAALRLFNVYGPGQADEGAYAAVIAAFLRAIRDGRPPTIFGDGLQTRDFVYVDDVVEAMRATAEVVLERGNVGPYNVGTGRAVTLLELWDAVAKAAGVDSRPVHRPARAGDVPHSCADVTKIQSEVGWSSTMGLEEGIRRLVASKS